MNANLVNQYVFLSCMIACLLASSCHKSQEPSSHNDPSKYRISEDVLWASPDDFDLTMDIYTPDSEKGPYPVIVMFHGGGWLINDKSIMEQALPFSNRCPPPNVHFQHMVDWVDPFLEQTSSFRIFVV